MKTFTESYKHYIHTVSGTTSEFGFDLERVAQIEPFLSLLHRSWWHVQFDGLEHLNKTGPALIVGNNGGVLPWPALMLMYTLMSSKANPRRLNIMANLDWVENERLYKALTDIGFVPWSSTNAKKLFSAGELIAIFPEGYAGATKRFAERYRLREFDWTQLLPAVEQSVPIYPLATLGCDEILPVFDNLEPLARLLGLPAYPITPFFPWLPFPANLLTLPVRWRMHLLQPVVCQPGCDRDTLENTASREAYFIQGGIQSELNRLLRARIKNHK